MGHCWPQAFWSLIPATQDCLLGTFKTMSTNLSRKKCHFLEALIWWIYSLFCDCTTFTKRIKCLLCLRAEINAFNSGLIMVSIRFQEGWVDMSGYIFPVLYITFGLYTFTLTLLSLRIYCYLHVPVIILRTHFH